MSRDRQRGSGAGWALARPGCSYANPGFSVHRQLARFVAAGFAPFEALQTATINPAKLLERAKDLGTIEKGELADLVLLDGDPTRDIDNTRTIRAVVLAGRYSSRDDLDRLLRAVELAARQ
jgi:imidazolonepropionase-like amidohydrolase